MNNAFTESISNKNKYHFSILPYLASVFLVSKINKRETKIVLSFSDPNISILIYSMSKVRTKCF